MGSASNSISTTSGNFWLGVLLSVVTAASAWVAIPVPGDLLPAPERPYQGYGNPEVRTERNRYPRHATGADDVRVQIVRPIGRRSADRFTRLPRRRIPVCGGAARNGWWVSARLPMSPVSNVYAHVQRYRPIVASDPERVLLANRLATAGAMMQSLFRNPLAEPSLTGVGPGAVLGAVVVFVTGWGATSVVALPLAAIGSALARAASRLRHRDAWRRRAHHDAAPGRHRGRRVSHRALEPADFAQHRHLAGRAGDRVLDDGRPRLADVGARLAVGAVRGDRARLGAAFRRARSTCCCSVRRPPPRSAWTSRPRSGCWCSRPRC